MAEPSADRFREASKRLRSAADMLPEKYLVEVTEDTPERMHPDVAKAAASWLDLMAWQTEQFRYSMSPFLYELQFKAEALASAILED